ncbi:MAG: tetratricopeptide repeat protein [Sphingobacteriaceae bacterium]|nr:tetratricopeptide repeat protein [Sphingobacteriaceae bacterium]
MSPKQVKIVLSVGALGLFVLLFIAPKIVSSERSKENKMASKANIDFKSNVEMYLSIASKALEPSLKKQADQFEKTAQKDIVFSDSLARFWDKLKRPDLASYILEKKAERTNKAADWFTAGNRYYYSVQFIKDETERPLLFQSAIRCFKSGLKQEPENIDSQIMMASCFVEGTESPMEGVTLLKEIEKKDSNNIKLQLTFAFFSVKSNQTDKAIVRFKKVLQLDPNYIEAYLHLADIYEQMNDVNKTIEVLQQYAAKTTDPTAKLEVEKYIKQLKLK